MNPAIAVVVAAMAIFMTIAATSILKLMLKHIFRTEDRGP